MNHIYDHEMSKALRAAARAGAFDETWNKYGRFGGYSEETQRAAVQAKARELLPNDVRLVVHVVILNDGRLSFDVWRIT